MRFLLVALALLAVIGCSRREPLAVEDPPVAEDLAQRKLDFARRKHRFPDSAKPTLSLAGAFGPAPGRPLRKIDLLPRPALAPEAFTRQGQILGRHHKAVISLAFSADGRMIVAGSFDGAVRVWNVEAGKEKATFQGHSPWLRVAFSPNGKTIASGSGKTVRLQDLSRGTRVAGAGKQVLQGAQGDISALAFSPDGGTLVAGAGKPAGRHLMLGDLYFWDTESGRQQFALLDFAGSIRSVAFSPDGKTFAAGSGKVHLWDTSTGKLKASLPEPSNVLAFAVDGTLAAACRNDDKIRIWSPGTTKARAVLSGHHGTVDSIALTRDGRLLASTSDDGTLMLWDVARATEMLTIETKHGLNAVAFSPDDTILAAGIGSEVVLWDVRSLKRLAKDNVPRPRPPEKDKKR
jgi:WD40 repeat protein